MSTPAFSFFEQRIVLDFDYFHYEIESIDLSDNSLYVGANDSWILKYANESDNPRGLKFSSRKRIAKTLGLKKPTEQIVVSSALERCLVLCDSVLMLLNAETLDPTAGNQSKIKGVSLFCLNENPGDGDPFALQICTVRKKRFCLYILKEDQFYPEREINTNAIPSAISMDGKFICAGMPTHYSIYDRNSAVSQTLFGKESEKEPSIVRRISNEEFLVMGPGRLGVFVKADGASDRPPLMWEQGVTAVSYAHPYVLALSHESVLVYSVIDYQLKESIPFYSGKNIGNYGGCTLVYSKRAVSQLSSIPWKRQVETLIFSGRVEEALEFARHSHHTGLSREEFEVEFLKLQQKAAIQFLSVGDFVKAGELFTDSRTDVRDVVRIFPDLSDAGDLPSAFDRADVMNVRDSLTDTEFRSATLEFFKDWLLDTKKQWGTSEAKRCADTALILILSDLADFVTLRDLLSKPLTLNVQKCVQRLELKSKFLQGLVYWNSGQENEALLIWLKIAQRETSDEAWPGDAFLVDKMVQVQDLAVFWRYIGPVLKLSADLALEILKRKCDKSEFKAPCLAVGAVCDFLQQHPFVLESFLEYLVFAKEDQTEKFHTQLALLLADAAILALEKGDESSEERGKLQLILKESKVVRHQVILARIEQTGLKAETSLIYGKIGDFAKAFKMLILEQESHEDALSLCLSLSKPECEKAMFELLSVYLDNKLESSQKDDFEKRAKSLLINHGHEFSVLQVLKVIPASWSLRDLDTLCISGARSALSSNRARKIERELLSYEVLKLNDDLSKYQNKKVVVNQIYCKVCTRQIFSSGFSRYPNGVVCHVSCVRRRNICPVTGEVFSFVKS